MGRTLVCSWCEHQWEIDDATAERKSVPCPECGTDADPVIDSLEYKQNPDAFRSVIQQKTANTTIVLPPTKDPGFYANNPDTLFLFSTIEGTPKAEIEIQGGAILESMSQYAGRKLAPLIIFHYDDWMAPEGTGDVLEDDEAVTPALSQVLGVIMERYELSEDEVMQFTVAPWPDPYKVIFAYGPQT